MEKAAAQKPGESATSIAVGFKTVRGHMAPAIDKAVNFPGPGGGGGSPAPFRGGQGPCPTSVTSRTNRRPISTNCIGLAVKRLQLRDERFSTN